MFVAGVRAQAADAGLRGDRLRRGGGEVGLPRLPRDRLRRPPVFATNTRFPEADEVVVDWPHRYLAAEQAAGRIDERTVLAVLTHDPKFDVPLLEVALRLPAVAYVGAMGSRRTHDDRIARLLEAGLDQKEIDRLSSPIGLDLGARTPEETAVSIAAEIIAVRWGHRRTPGQHRTHPPGPGLPPVRRGTRWPAAPPAAAAGRVQRRPGAGPRGHLSSAWRSTSTERA